MSIKRIVPDVESSDLEGSKAFYGDFLGLELAMDQGWVMTFASRSNPTAQVTIVESESSKTIQPDMSVEVDDIHGVYASANERGLEIEYPLTVEPWGVTRFFVRDPNGKLVNILSHTNAEQGVDRNA